MIDATSSSSSSSCADDADDADAAHDSDTPPPYILSHLCVRKCHVTCPIVLSSSLHTHLIMQHSKWTQERESVFVGQLLGVNKLSETNNRYNEKITERGYTTLHYVPCLEYNSFLYFL